MVRQGEKLHVYGGAVQYQQGAIMMETTGKDTMKCQSVCGWRRRLWMVGWLIHGTSTRMASVWVPFEAARAS